VGRKIKKLKTLGSGGGERDPKKIKGQKVFRGLSKRGTALRATRGGEGGAAVPLRSPQGSGGPISM
jgi:hypothetical protein